MTRLFTRAWIVVILLGCPMTASSDEPDLKQRVDELEKVVDVLQKRVSEREQTQLKSDSLRVYWKEGLRLESADEVFKLRIGGRIMNDWAFVSAHEDLEDALGSDLDDGTEFRWARIALEGTIYDRTEFKIEYDFAGSALTDVYLGLIKLPVIGNIRIGHFKEPFSLEELTSNKFITFMERSSVNVFAPARNTGLMLYKPALNERVTWAAGVFRDTDKFGKDVGDDGYAFTGRVTALPWYEEKGWKLLHIGAAYSHREANGDTVQFKGKPDANLAPDFVDTGKFDADQMDLVGAEAALVYGPASLQAEFVNAMVETPGGSDPSFSAYYVMGSYFLTGEYRPYETATAAFCRVKPNRNFLAEGGGIGAWEVAARYAYLDLTDEDVDGGELRTIDAGLNWYLNPNMRIMWNYTFADADEKYESNANIFQMRFQVDF